MRRLLAVLVAAAAIASPVSAQTRPDFSGVWALDPSTAQMGLTAATITVKQDAKTINVASEVTTTMGSQKATNVFNLDGTESKNTVNSPMGSVDMASTVAWAGDTLVVTTKAEMQGQSLLQTEKWSMADGGKKLNVDRTVAAGGQNGAVKLVFNKQ